MSGLFADVHNSSLNPAPGCPPEPVLSLSKPVLSSVEGDRLGGGCHRKCLFSEKGPGGRPLSLRGAGATKQSLSAERLLRSARNDKAAALLLFSDPRVLASA